MPVPLRTYLTDVLSPVVAIDAGGLMASAAPTVRDAIRDLHVIGHSAGSFSAIVISDILQDLRLGPLVGCTRVTAIAFPGKLFETRYPAQRTT